MKEREAIQPLVGEGGIQHKPSSRRDPYEVLDDLMVVIEAICPVWPERDTFKDEHQFRL